MRSAVVQAKPVQYLIVALNLSLSYFRAGKLAEAIDCKKPLLEFMTSELRKIPLKLETENNPFYQHLALRLDKSAAQKDYPIRFHIDLDVKAR